jgi:sugar lactone lactonase YvrE
MTTDVLIDGLGFAESPRWHDGRLWFSDMDRRAVYALHLDTRRLESVAEVARRPSGVGWLPDGRMMVVSMEDRRLLRAGQPDLVPVADLTGLASFHCNDMVVDGEGRAYVGNFGYDYAAGAPGRAATLILVSPDGAARLVGEPLWFPNGMCITPDGGTLIVAETMGCCLTAFTIGFGGELYDRRLFAELEATDDGPSRPDGICLDAEGAVWTAAGHEVLRMSAGGAVLDRVSTGEWGAVACTLAGPDRRTLAVTTFQKRDSARRARIEAVEVDVPGAGLP